MWDEASGGQDQIIGNISIDDEFVDLPFNKPVKFKTIGFTRNQISGYMNVYCKTMSGIKSFQISSSSGIRDLYINVDGMLQEITSDSDSEIVIDTINNKIYIDDNEYPLDTLIISFAPSGNTSYFYIENIESIRLG